MLTALTLINIAVASTMISNDYESIKQYQAEQVQIEQPETLANLTSKGES